MTGETPFPTPRPVSPPPYATAARRRGRLVLIVALLAFLLGVVAMYYVLPVVERWWGGEPSATTTTTTAATPATQQTATPAGAPSAAATTATLDTLAAREATLDAQLRAIEGRIAGVDAASRTAAGYARRAEGLLVAFAARRALDRGLQLGYVEGQLRDRFGDQPQAVATVTAAARAPVTLADLREGLTRIAPTLTSGSRDAGFLASAWREVSNLVILRRDTTPSPRPDDRLERARVVLDGGNVEAALAEVVRMPGAADASAWIDAAKRYIDARRALNALELAAIDGRGSAPAPVAAAPEPSLPSASPAATDPTPAGQLPGA